MSGCGQAAKEQEVITETNNFVYVSDSLKINKFATYYFHIKVPVLDSITDISLLESMYAPIGISTNDYTKNNLQKILLEQKEQYFSENAPDLNEFDNEDESDMFYALDDAINMEVFSRKDNFLTMIYTYSGYGGGAHGYYNEIYKIFDIKNRKPVLLEDIIINTDEETWSSTLMNKLPDEDGNIADMLLVDTISLTDNFYFDNEGITFVYNKYEIAAYAAGVIYIKIPFKDIKGLLTPDFTKLVL